MLNERNQIKNAITQFMWHLEKGEIRGENRVVAKGWEWGRGWLKKPARGKFLNVMKVFCISIVVVLTSQYAFIYITALHIIKWI